MIECIDLAFDHILLAPISNRKRNRESDVVDESVDNISSKRSSSSRSSGVNEGDVVCTVIKAKSTGSRKCTQ